MRFIAVTLAAVSAAVVMGGAAPTLSGMQVPPQCDIAQQSPLPLRAPTNLHIISKIGFEGLSARGPNAGPAMESQAPTRTATAAGDPHAYYRSLASRRDCFAAYSLRDQTQIEQYRQQRFRPTSVNYVYPNDPDPRRQDAAKITIEEETADLRTQIHLPIGPHHPQNLLVTWDIWWGQEFNYAHFGTARWKGVPQFGSPDEKIWLSLHTAFITATQHTENLPPGGPYVTMTYPHSSNTGNVKYSPWFRDTGVYDGKTLRNRLPYDAPRNQQRGYPESVGPWDTSVRPGGMEFGVVAERWTRYWVFFERAESEDWIGTHGSVKGREMRAYKWSVWAADTERDPVRILNEAIVGVHPDSPGGFGRLRIEMDSSLEKIPPGRGVMTLYTRNYVVLHGTRKADVLAILQKPVN